MNNLYTILTKQTDSIVWSSIEERIKPTQAEVHAFKFYQIKLMFALFFFLIY